MLPVRLRGPFGWACEAFADGSMVANDVAMGGI